MSDKKGVIIKTRIRSRAGNWYDVEFPAVVSCRAEGVSVPDVIETNDLFVKSATISVITDSDFKK